MKSAVIVVTAASIASCLSSVIARSLQKRAAFYIANETACVVDSIVYYNGDPIPTDDPCEACKCRPPGFACVLRECEVKPGCRAVRKAGHCCPEYICGCEHNGRMFRDGDEIKDSQNPCYTCHCQGSAIACAFVDCFFRVDCAPNYVPGECCPRYDHCLPLGSPVNETISNQFPSSQSPSSTQTTETVSRKTTLASEVFTDYPLFGLGDFANDWPRKPIATGQPDSIDDNHKVIPETPSNKPQDSTDPPSTSEDPTAPIFYIPKKDGVTENNEKKTEASITESIRTNEITTSSISSQTETYTTTRVNDSPDLFLHDNADELPKEEIIPSEIHSNHGVESTSATDQTKLQESSSTVFDLEISSISVTKENNKNVSTTTPIPVLFLNAKDANSDDKSNDKLSETTTTVLVEHSVAIKKSSQDNNNNEESTTISTTSQSDNKVTTLLTTKAEEITTKSNREGKQNVNDNLITEPEKTTTVIYNSEPNKEENKTPLSTTTSQSTVSVDVQTIDKLTTVNEITSSTTQATTVSEKDNTNEPDKLTTTTESITQSKTESNISNESAKDLIIKKDIH